MVTARGADADVTCLHLLGTLAAMDASEVTAAREEAEREELERQRHRAEHRSRMEVLFLARPVEQVHPLVRMPPLSDIRSTFS